MEQVASTGCFADDDDDLEQLRLAALKSLKKPLGAYSEKVPVQQKPFFNKNGLNRGRGCFHGRVHRNGQFNHRTRNTNLIAVPLISDDTEDTTTTTTKTSAAAATTNSSSKLILPQDRYCKSNATFDEKSEEQNSKFNRYNDKSDSESESDDDEEGAEEDVEEEPPKKLERSNSLEALMQELENEIEGKSGEESKVKVKVKKVKKKVEEVDEKQQQPPVVEQKKVVEQKFEKKVVVSPPPPPVQLPVQQPYVAPPVQLYYQPPVIPPPYNTLPPVVHYEPPIRYERIPSPLTINTDLLSTTVTAPLSPRSAAFVMQNREIIERRKRRSYSRSPSPRYRRSRTKSRSPKTLRTNTPPPPPPRRRGTPEKKSSVYDRLGARIEKVESPSKKKRSRSKSPKLDPVLEARKRKFESNELKIKEGVIRLKPKNEQEEEEEEAAAAAAAEAEEEPETDDVIDVTVDDLFSDEETDNENEGRFKSATNKETQKPSGVVSFQRLTNKENEKQKKRLMKKAQLSRLMVRTDKHKIPPQPPVSTLPEKKIEIKIRNPTKYEEKKEPKEKKATTAAPAAVRKVEIGPHVESGEIVEEHEDRSDDDEEVVDLNEGDLRAQLSRKRAERQSKHSVDETVASRLLQSALESAVFKKAKQSKRKTTSTTRDGKLPIHSRLGLTQQPVKKKRKRNKRSGGLEQV